ncbi:PfkB family carbohydrate kinase, partial [Burkholderia oklahomensis]|uniref:PfkB family carbohydrate kinase n=1 Tax=Burkholderia oklahomensis TaxID=342113 RepID=UPI0022B60B27
MKPNLAELEAALGRALGDDDAIVHAACELAARGIAYVVVSLGAKGALGVAADVAAGASGASEASGASGASEAPAVSKASVASKASVGSRTFDAGESSKRATGETVDALASSSASSGGDGRPSSTGRSASPALTSPASTSPASTSTTAGASTSPQRTPPQRTPPHPAIYRIFRATPPRVPVASTVGAGDAFVAGLVASLTE